MSPLPRSISGFTPIPIFYPSTPSTSSVTHIIYVRPHINPKNKKNRDTTTFPEGRTLFLVNIPPGATERELSQWISKGIGSGVVERILFAGDVDAEEGVLTHEEDSDEEDEDEELGDEEQKEQHPRKKRKLSKEDKAKVIPKVIPLPSLPTRTFHKTGSSAHIIFLDSSSLSRFLTSVSQQPKPKPWPLDTSISSGGLSHYASQYDSLRPPLDLVKAHVDTWMELFEYEQQEKKRKLLQDQESKFKKGEAIVDEDGFTLVTRGGAYGQTVGGGVAVASKKFQKEVSKGREGGGGGKRNRKNKKKDPKEKDSFYAFQVHEKKRKELIDLKQKWEDDKAKVEKLKSSRKFRPY